MKKRVFLASLSIIVVMSDAALSYPMVRSGFSGSYFLAYATNPEEKSFNCNFQYSFNYKDFGELKSRTIAGQFFVNAQAKDERVVYTTGSWVEPVLTSFQFNCT